MPRHLRSRVAVIAALLPVLVLVVASPCIAEDSAKELLEQVRLGHDEPYEQTRALTERLRRDHPDSPEAVAAMWFLAGRAQRTGREDEATRLWRELETLAPYEAGRGQAAAWARMGVKEARWRIAAFHERHGEWEQALGWWRKAETYGWCGNGIAWLTADRDWHVALCLLRLGREDEALQAFDEAVFRENMYCDIRTVAAWVRLKQERVGIDGVRDILRGADKAYPPSGVAMAREYLGMLDMRVAGDVAGLWGKLDQRPLRSHGERWRSSLAFELLSQIGGPAISLARERLSRNDFDEAAWAAAILVAAGAENAPELIAERVRVQIEDFDYPNIWILRELMFTLMLHGSPEALATIRRYAAEAQGNQKRAAEQILEEFPTPEAARAHLTFDVLPAQ